MTGQPMKRIFFQMDMNVIVPRMTNASLSTSWSSSSSSVVEFGLFCMTINVLPNYPEAMALRANRGHRQLDVPDLLDLARGGVSPEEPDVVGSLQNLLGTELDQGTDEHEALVHLVAYVDQISVTYTSCWAESFLTDDSGHDQAQTGAHQGDLQRLRE
jgi:hypothetical protein